MDPITPRKACLKAAHQKRLILSSGTGTTPDVPPENIKAMVDTVTEYGVSLQ
jgi:uroporphyrinogen-III decarboxylase